MIITINGMPGSGKSTVGRELAKRLGYKFYSAGDVRGRYAVSRGISMAELNRLAEKDPASDKLVDEYLAEIAKKEDDFIVDARLGFHFIPQSIKVFLDANPEVRAQRVFGDSRPDEKFKSLGDAKRAITNRVKSDLKRYANLYSINPYEHQHYDLIIDTTDKKVEEIVGQVYRFSMFRSNPAKR